MFQKIKVYLVPAFCVVETILLSLILFTDFYTAYVSFSVIITCFLASLIFIKDAKYNFLVSTALFFTVVSDFFLVVLFTYYPHEFFQSLAVTTFSVTQLCYFAYLIVNTSGSQIQRHITIRIIACVVAIALPIFILHESANYLALITMFYFANLLVSTAYAFRNYKKSPLFAIGLVFFILCDLFVGMQIGHGMFFTLPENSILYKIFFAPFNFMWLFYTISQTLIVLSLKYNKLEKEPLMTE